MHATVYILKRVQIIENNIKTPYELWYGRPPTIKYFKIFGSKCYIGRDENDLRKYDSREDEGIFLGYCMNRKAYKCYNKRLNKIVVSTNV